MWWGYVLVAVLAVAALALAGIGLRDRIGTDTGVWLLWSLIAAIWLIGLTSPTMRS